MNDIIKNDIDRWSVRPLPGKLEGVLVDLPDGRQYIHVDTGKTLAARIDPEMTRRARECTRRKYSRGPLTLFPQ